MTYVPHNIAHQLREGGDGDLAIELQQQIKTLAQEDQEFLSFYAIGFSPREAARHLGLRGNSQSRFNRLVRDLAVGVNGGAQA